MSLKFAKLIDPASGVMFVFDAIAMQLFEYLKWQVDEFSSEDSSTVVFFGHYNTDDNPVCSILIADASNDQTEPDISLLKFKDVSSLHAELMEGVTNANLESGVITISFEDSKLVMQNGRRYLKTECLVEKHGALFKSVNYRFNVADNKFVLIFDYDVSSESDLSPKLEHVFDSLLFVDRLTDENRITDIINKVDAQEILSNTAKTSEDLLGELSEGDIEAIKERAIEQVLKDDIDVCGFKLPPVLETYSRLDDYRDYETESPGLGCSVGFSRPGSEATVYVYDLKKSFIDDSELEEEFDKALSEISYSLERQKENGLVSFDFGRAYKVTTEQNLKLLIGKYDLLTSGDYDKTSFLYLTHVENKFVKVRATCLSDEIQYGNPDSFTNSLLQHIVFGDLYNESR